MDIQIEKIKNQLCFPRMEASWSSSTWAMQPRMWQMPKSVWRKPEKSERMAWSIAHTVDSVDDDMLCFLVMANDG